MDKPAQPSELSAALQRLGAKRVEAALVASLADGGALGTSEIVERTGLRQPEVSVGMQELRARNWVAYDAVPREGKGRPMHRYRLVADKEVVRAYYEMQARGAIDAFQAALAIVRRHLSGASSPSVPPGGHGPHAVRRAQDDRVAQA